jgi:hypothetical protein
VTVNIRSFSGTHDWHPSVLNDTDAHEAGTADDIITNIEEGFCPRCERPLPTPPEFPAGSRITQCRSIPICGRCGGDEAYEILGPDGLSGAGCWPLSVDLIDARRAQFEANAKPAIITGDGHLLTEDGVAPIVVPRNTGGWAQYGQADESTD